MKYYLLQRFSEASTWRGLIAFATAAGIAISPDQIDTIVSAGLAIVGLLAVFLPDHVAK
jgi:hypothetical protein